MANPSDKNPMLGKWLVVAIVSLAVLAATAGAFLLGMLSGNDPQASNSARNEPIARAREIQTPSPYVVIKPSDGSPNPAASETLPAEQPPTPTVTILQAQTPTQTPVPAQTTVPTQAVG